MWYAALLLLPLAAPTAAPDTLVVCPSELRHGLTAWEDFRQQQGHRIVVIDAPANAAELQSTIRNVSRGAELKYLLIVGDVPDAGAEAAAQQHNVVPTNYVTAKINPRWGSSTTIATDLPYGDVDGDGLPDLAVGRIPADSATDLAAVVRKIIRYEREVEHPEWSRRIHMVAGIGGFGAVTDSIIEAAAAHVVRQTVPAHYDIQRTAAHPGSPHYPPGRFTEYICQQFAEAALVWVYMGHGRQTELDFVATPDGKAPILSVTDVPNLRCGPQSPIAVLVACHTGAIDAEEDCLAERMLTAEAGPVAAIAATRVTMPYGNTVLGYELLRACFHDRPQELGAILRAAQRRSLSHVQDDSLRTSLDKLASGFASQPSDLVAERQEHVWMYHLLGDPLLRLHRPADGDEANVAIRNPAAR